MLGEYATSVTMKMLSSPPPTTERPHLDWLALKGKRAYIVGEKGSQLKIDPGSFKALREPQQTIKVRGLWAGEVEMSCIGKLVVPENTRTEFAGGLDGGVRRSVLCWHHLFQFVMHPQPGTDQRQKRDIMNQDYVAGQRAGFWALVMAFDEVWGPALTAGTQVGCSLSCATLIQDAHNICVFVYLLAFGLRGVRPWQSKVPIPAPSKMQWLHS